MKDIAFEVPNGIRYNLETEEWEFYTPNHPAAEMQALVNVSVPAALECEGMERDINRPILVHYRIGRPDEEDQALLAAEIELPVIGGEDLLLYTHKNEETGEWEFTEIDGC